MWEAKTEKNFTDGLLLDIYCFSQNVGGGAEASPAPQCLSFIYKLTFK